jgi:FtsP/CotA-like multicopper oxidase with cupredoxin domain
VSRNQRIALIALAVAVAAAAFVVAQPGDDDEEEARTSGAKAGETATSDRARTAEAKPPPAVERIRVEGGRPVGGVKEITVKQGDTVRIAVSADAADEIHLHGYDITKRPAPGRPARFVFEANAEGVFDMESHVAEHAGKEPLVARLVVEPS